MIIGNGPSLSLDLLSRIKTEGLFTFAANGLCLVFDETEFRPDIVCMSNYDAINRYGEHYPVETVKFFKSGWRQKCTINIEIDNVYELPFACEHDLGIHKAQFIKDGNFTSDPFSHNFCGDTVLLDFAIPMAFYMGFTCTYLCGVDCDYSKGYFTPKYPKSAIANFRGMINQDYSIAVPSYMYAKDFLSAHGRKLYKLTESNHLDFIETCSLKQAFEKGVQ